MFIDDFILNHICKNFGCEIDQRLSYQNHRSSTTSAHFNNEKSIASIHLDSIISEENKKVNMSDQMDSIVYNTRLIQEQILMINLNNGLFG